MAETFKVICKLCSPLCKEAPYLDALLYNELMFKQGLCKSGKKLSRGDSVNEIKEIRIPLKSVRYNNIPVYFCSNPVYKINYEYREDFSYHIEPELCFLLSDKEKKSISSTSGIYKDRRLPIRLKLINEIVWFCNGTKNSVLEILQSITSVGSLRKQGFGVISEWKHSCEHYLTNKAMNRIAWLGQASLCYGRSIPSCFRSGFNLLSEEQKNNANEIALEYLNKWLVANNRYEVTIEAGLGGSDRQMEIY